MRNKIIAALERYGPDYIAAQIRFFRRHRRVARIMFPRSFSDHVTQRMLFGRDPRYSMLADKIDAKRFVAGRLGPSWVIPSLYEGAELPPLEQRNWPRPFVIKASHGSGWNLFVRDKGRPDWSSIERAVEGWLSTSYAKHVGERLYASIPRRILVEPLIGNPAELPTDLKFFCFGGRVEYVMVQSERHLDLKIAVMDRDWRMLPVRYTYERPAVAPRRPDRFARLVEAAETLAAGFDFVRMDFYEIDSVPLFGEFTFTPGAGLEVFEPYEFNLAFGAHWRRASQQRGRGALRSAQGAGHDRLHVDPTGRRVSR